MKRISAILQKTFLISLLMQFGCEPKTPSQPAATHAAADPLCSYVSYAPTKVRIMPLTDFARRANNQDQPGLRVYVTLLDSFGSQVKTPATFRFELYQYIERSAVPEGRRLAIWPDIDLNDAVQNNSFWRDFLRAYEFNLDFDPVPEQTYVLQVTCMCPLGTRLSTDFKIKYDK